MMYLRTSSANPSVLRSAVLGAARCAVLLALACAPGPPVREPEGRPLRVLVAEESVPLLPGLGGDVERVLARGIARIAGRDLVLVPWEPEADPLARLQADEVDVVATGLAFATEPPEGVAFSLPYRHEDAPVVLALRARDVDLRRRVNELLISRSFAEGDEVHRDDLEGIRRRGSLRLIARSHVGSFFLQSGDPVGFEYELLRRFAEEQGLALEIVSPGASEDAEQWLLSGRGDVLAANPDGPRRAGPRLALTRPVARVGMVVAVRDDDPHPARELGDLTGRTLAVRRRGPERRLAEQIAAAVEGLRIEQTPADIGPVRLLAGVGDGRWDAALVPAHLVRVEQHAGRRLKSALTVGTASLSWGVRPANRELRAALDAFLAREVRGSEYNVLWRKYLRSAAAVAEAGSAPGRLSPYDPIVRRWAAAHELDWRLVVAQMAQESRFELGRVSPSGAAGLMQIVPETANELGLRDPHDPEESIRAGTRYLRRLADLYEPGLPLATRLRFALASYSAGPGHVMDARRLAKELGLDPNRWYGHVERAILLLEQPEYYENARCGYCRGSETVRYVAEIDRRYRLYVQHVPLDGADPSPDAGSIRGLPAGPASPLPPA